MRHSIKTSILLSFLAVILFTAVSIGALGMYIINDKIIKRAQNQVIRDLGAARMIYNDELNRIGKMFDIVFFNADTELTKEKLGLDYLFNVPSGEMGAVMSRIAKKAFETKQEVSSTRVINIDELERIGNAYIEKAYMKIEFTPKASPTEKKFIGSVMALECAKPILDETGKVKSVIFGGKIINEDYTLVDKIKDLIYEDRLYASKPIGTVTIFQDDVRISTNVLNKEKKRAIGTRVSKVVYDNVVGEGERWLDRAFVVTDWYFTGYEPIRDIDENIVGILYVGILEEPFKDIAERTLFVFLMIIAATLVIAVIVSFILAGFVARPVTNMLKGTEKISKGELEYQVSSETGIKELDILADSFNRMSDKLHESYKDLKFTNNKLESLNKSYLDLIGFVSHELKGILASTILNAYSVRDGYLGMVNFKQQKALNSITRNLDHLESTVKNFLSLSRIEKGEMTINKQKVFLKEDIFDVSIETFMKQIGEKNMLVVNALKKEDYVFADRDLFLVVANNLISNAVKYGKDNGRIEINSFSDEKGIEVRVFNEGTPLSKEQAEKLFKRFSRIHTEENKNVKGTGLGLFITKEIIEKHDGEITVETNEKGNIFICKIRKGE